ncbi:MAG: hypothetical protein R3D00_07820 [Bacteroidia bacterium]
MKYLYILTISLILGFSSYRLCMKPEPFSSKTCAEMPATDSLRTMFSYQPLKEQEEPEESYDYESVDLSVVALYAVINFFLDLYQ